LVQAKYVERAPQAKLGPYVWGQLQSHAVKASKTVKYAQRSGHLIFDKQEDGRWFLPEGLPEEVSAKAGLATAIAPGMEASPDNQFLVTFHPSFTYEDFVEGFRPESGETGDETVRYPLRPGIFKQACERAVQLAGFAHAIEVWPDTDAYDTAAAAEDTFTAKVCLVETPFTVTVRLRFAGDEVWHDSEVNLAFGATQRPQLQGRAGSR